MFNTIQKNILREFLIKEGFSFTADLSSAQLHFHGFGTMKYQILFNREGKLSFLASNSLPNGSYKCWNKMLSFLESFCPGDRFLNEDRVLLFKEAKAHLESLPQTSKVLKDLSSQEDHTVMVWATDEDKRQHGWRVSWTFSFDKEGEIQICEKRRQDTVEIPVGF